MHQHGSMCKIYADAASRTCVNKPNTNLTPLLPSRLSMAVISMGLSTVITAITTSDIIREVMHVWVGSQRQADALDSTARYMLMLICSTVLLKVRDCPLQQQGITVPEYISLCLGRGEQRLVARHCSDSTSQHHKASPPIRQRQHACGCT